MPVFTLHANLKRSPCTSRRAGSCVGGWQRRQRCLLQDKHELLVYSCQKLLETRGLTVVFLGPFLGRKTPIRFSNLSGVALAGGGRCLDSMKGWFPSLPFLGENSPKLNASCFGLSEIVEASSL